MYTAIACLNNRQSPQEPQYFAFLMDAESYYFDCLQRCDIDNYRVIQVRNSWSEGKELRFKMIGEVMDMTRQINGDFPEDNIERTIAAYERCEMGVLEGIRFTLRKKIATRKALGNINGTLKEIDRMIVENKTL